jgi:hypothetical protein
MDDIVRILFVEDTEDDVELARRELDRDPPCPVSPDRSQQ